MDRMLHGPKCKKGEKAAPTVFARLGVVSIGLIQGYWHKTPCVGQRLKGGGHLVRSNFLDWTILKPRLAIAATKEAMINP